MKKTLALLALLGIFMVSCSDDDGNDQTQEEQEETTYTSGSADFSTYVSVGNSLTAGYSDAALFTDGQTASYPNMLATNFALAGGGDFSIPFMNDNLGGLTLAGDALPGFGNRLILSFASGSAAPVAVDGNGSTEVSNILSGSFNNMGVPGAKSYHLLAPGYGNIQGLATETANPYFVRFASDPNTTVIADAVAQSPTFFSLWIGNNDILGYATNGGEGVDQTGNLDPSTYGSSDISDPNVVANAINGLLQTLTANGAGGVIANIPDVTTIPYFTTVPFAPLDPTNPDFGPLIPTLNENFAGLNGVFAFLEVPERSIVFNTDAASAVVIKDESLTDLSASITAVLMANGIDAGTASLTGFLYGQARQATEDDLITLPAQNVVAELNTEIFTTLTQTFGLSVEQAGQLSVNGITFPLEDEWVLTPSEQELVSTATTAYNTTISTLATQYDIAFVDANAYLTTIATAGQALSDGSTVTATYATGGGFSLDGVHPSPRGYALLANLFVDAINTKYGSNLPGVEPLDYTGLYIN